MNKYRQFFGVRRLACALVFAGLPAKKRSRASPASMKAQASLRTPKSRRGPHINEFHGCQQKDVSNCKGKPAHFKKLSLLFDISGLLLGGSKMNNEGL